MLRFDTVVVSDLHLGARNSRCEDFLRFLDDLTVDRLVIAGDLFESPVLHGLRAQHVRVLEVLRQFARSSELIWLRGNHDPDESWCRDVLDLHSRDELVVHAGRRRYLICHGHIWDRALLLPNVIINVADSAYHLAQRLDPSHRLARWLKRKTKLFCMAVDGLRREAIAAARLRNMDGVIVGHSHVAGDDSADDLHFLNCGCWTEQPTGYVGMRGEFARQYVWQAPERVCLPGRGAKMPRSADTVPLLVGSGEGA
ncbi:MAG: UDP-2,3-diacylglucosamine diphosphatase [Pirellulales bacterium]